MGHIEQSTRWLIAKLVFVGISLAGLLSSNVGGIHVEAQVSPGWSDPINLSKTGFTDTPSMVIDSDGTYHVIWEDEFAGIVYVNGDGVNWSVPEVIALPSGDVIPLLVADNNSSVHAFWRDSNGVLFHSKVRGTDFASFSAWTSPFLLDSSALNFDAELDENGEIHLSYIRTEEVEGLPAGVYHRRLRSETNDWFTPSLLYFSHYLRSTEIANSNVDISTSTIADQISVYIVWDNYPRGRVYLAKSLDGGETWSDPLEVDKPDEVTATSGTAGIKVSTVDHHVIIVWQRRYAGGNCSQYYQWSDDYGDTWNNPQQMLENSSGCGVENQFLLNEDGQIILWTMLQNQVNLLAWDQRRWSEPQIQHELSAIEDPETLSLVAFDCRQPLMMFGNLAVVGCDEGDGGDIWFLSRELSDISDWYASPSDWSDPEELVASQNEINTPLLVAGSDELLHIVWSQEVNLTGTDSSTSIYYIGWDGERWSQPLTVFQSAEGNASQPSAALDDDGRLLVVWSESQSGDILFSWANAARAGRLAEWAEPLSLPISQPVAVSPNILVDSAGRVFVLYAVPVNEERGIYLASSTDGGDSWSTPVQVFNGVDAGWQIVDEPQLIQTSNGDLHALWLHKALPGNNGTLGLYYSHSEDGGGSWSEAEDVVEGEVNWSQISSDAQGTVYRMWQEEINNQTIIRYERSSDNESGWTLPESLSSFGESLRIARLVVDQIGQLHLLQIVQDLSGRLILRHWLWEDGRWVVSENTELAYAPSTDVLSMAAAVSSEEEMDLVYSTTTETELSEVMQNNMYFTNRLLELPSEAIPVDQISTPEPVDTPLPSATPTVESFSTPTIEPTNTPSLNSLDPVENGGSGSNTYDALVVGGVLAGLIVLAVFGYAIIRVRGS